MLTNLDNHHDGLCLLSQFIGSMHPPEGICPIISIRVWQTLVHLNSCMNSWNIWIHIWKKYEKIIWIQSLIPLFYLRGCAAPLLGIKPIATLERFCCLLLVSADYIRLRPLARPWPAQRALGIFINSQILFHGRIYGFVWKSTQQQLNTINLNTCKAM